MTQPATQILIVDDDPALRELLQRYLGEQGYAVAGVTDGTAMDQHLETHAADLIILDLMLPGLDGLDVLRRLRDDGVTVPVLILTAKGQESDRVQGLDLGADDYIVKPFSVRELVARVGAHLRARSRTCARQVQLGEVEFDFATRQARRDGEPIPVLPKEIDLAHFLLENRGRVVTRDELLLKVWEYPIPGIQTRTVDNYIMKLRQKVEPDPARPRLILTVRGKGYRLADA